MFKKIDHVEIIPRDYERSLLFYTRVLGFAMKERQPVGRPPLNEVAFLDLGGTVVELMSVTDPGAAPSDQWQAGYRMIALEVDDMDKAIEYLHSKGVELSKPAVSLGTSRRAEIMDPDGFSIELRQW